MKPRPFKHGDRIRVQKPAFYLRCGYPMLPAVEAERFRTIHTTSIRKFIADMGVETDEHGRPFHLKAFGKICAALGADYCAQNRFGGRERTIHTIELPEHAGLETYVNGVFRRKTGTYEPGTIRQTYEGEEHEPPYLSNEATHTIIETGEFHYLDHVELEPMHRGLLCIEAANVELITGEVQ